MAKCSLAVQMREQLLSFVVTGGGPTGVEVAAELHDMVLDDMRKVRRSQGVWCLLSFAAVRTLLRDADLLYSWHHDC